MIKVPLELLNLNDDGFHLLVEVVVFGQPFKAVLDTGASKTVFDKTVVSGLIADSDSLKSTDKLTSGLGTNSMESFILTVPELKVGKLSVVNFEAAVIDLASINYAYEKMNLPAVIGVLGGDILMSYNAVIDYGKSVLKLFP